MATYGKYKLITNWQRADQCFIARATLDEKVYFLKRYENYIEPARSPQMREDVYARLNADFERFTSYRADVIKAISKVATPGGNLVYPTDWFIENHFYVEATEYIPDLIEETDLYRLSPLETESLMKTATGALCTLHRAGIVHGEINLDNVVAERNPNVGSGFPILAKLIDLDKSYFADRLPAPEDFAKSRGYMSPEMNYCIMRDFEDGSMSALCAKSDIFSLGLLFHKLLTKGEFPDIVDLPDEKSNRDDIYPGEALSADGKLLLKKSKIKEEYLLILIANMLNPKAEGRPTAQEVLEVLKTKKVLNGKLSKRILIERDEEDALLGEESGAEEESEAPFTYLDGYKEPCPEHNAVFDVKALVDAGFIAVERDEGAKTYTLYGPDGSVNKYTIDRMISMGLAKPKAATATFDSSTSHTKDEMWSEHEDYEWVPAKIAAFKFAYQGRSQRGEKLGYIFFNSMGQKRFFELKDLINLGFVKKKPDANVR